jgi:hypothetical protein
MKAKEEDETREAPGQAWEGRSRRRRRRIHQETIKGWVGPRMVEVVRKRETLFVRGRRRRGREEVN